MDPETGSFIDQDGRLHKGDWSGELDDDEIIERIEKGSSTPMQYGTAIPKDVLSTNSAKSFTRKIITLQRMKHFRK